MANEATVDIPEDGVVTIDVPEGAEVAASASGETVEQLKQASAANKETTAATRVAGEGTGRAADEAAAQLLDAKRREDDARRRADAAEAQVNAERRRSDELERVAAQRGEEVKGLRDTADQSRLAAINAQIDAQTKEIASAEQELIRANEAGEFAKAAAAQVKLSKAAAALDRNTADKTALEQSAARAATTTATIGHEGRVTAPVLPPVEQYLAGFADRPRAQAWLRSHPECLPEQVADQTGRPVYLGGNAAKNKAMMRGHHAALSQDIEANTDEYFRILEEYISDNPPTSTAAQTTPAGQQPVQQPAQRKQPAQRAQPSAPVNNAPPHQPGQPRQRQVRLNKEQQDAAKFSFPHLPEAEALKAYATNLAALEAEGKMGRTTH